MTDQTETPEADAPEIAEAVLSETRLSDEQLARVEAMTFSRTLLTGEIIPSGLGAMFGGNRSPVSLGTSFVSDLVFLSEYILDGVEEAEVEPVAPSGLSGLLVSLGGLICTDPECPANQPDAETESAEGDVIEDGPTDDVELDGFGEKL